MEFLAFLWRRADDMLTLGLQHIAVVATALALATVIGVGVGVATYRRERPREIALAVAGAFLTIPSFALLVLFVGPLGLGARNVVVALTMYGLLPVLRNTIIGLREVDPFVVEPMIGGFGRTATDGPGASSQLRRGAVERVHTGGWLRRMRDVYPMCIHGWLKAAVSPDSCQVLDSNAVRHSPP